ncbi:GNAT family N-acetyltransferase [Catellatospora citrea]|uniref:N-acetyltransferase GCN5 n=1 Tax=Catellatospora citrea TaxID=53366 RepID=A0A8J3K7T5_9ACTN|nr:GNAT family protein [Catellatospora citrea]RKE00412.1 ribosomal-protein-alanine N-acetyltransferase [Catellatospora citrea]GIF98072.1 N-acetyltransferase GCN5 [Catellatospora citrea]
MYPVRIEGERIVLREFEERDLDASMAVVGDPDVTVSLSFDTRAREEQAERLAADLRRALVEPRPDYYLAIADRRTDELIGFIRVGLGGHRSGELGYALRKDRWRQGLTYEAAQLMLTFGFEALALHRIQAACGPDNFASQAMLQRLGFEYEGRMRHHVFTNSAWRDSLLYAKIINN